MMEVVETVSIKITMLEEKMSQETLESVQLFQVSTRMASHMVSIQ